MFSDVFRGYTKATSGCNGFKVDVGVIKKTKIWSFREMRPIENLKFLFSPYCCASLIKMKHCTNFFNIG